MNTDARHSFEDPQGRRLGAIAALVLGLFVGLTLLPIPLTGPVGSALGRLLWQGLGVGALGFPLLGVGVALAGFDRLPKLDMKRAAFLLGGLSVLVPSLIGLVVVSQIPSHEFPPSAAEWPWPEKAVGIIPAIVSTAIYSQIGFLGGILIWFLALSALTLLTFAWHPLQRLERPSPAVTLARAAEDGLQGVRAEDEPEPPTSRRSTVSSEDAAKLRRKPRKGDRIDPGVLAAVKAEDEAELPPIELLHPPPAQDIDAGEAQLDRLGQVLIDTLKTFKVDATPGGRTTGPVVTQFEIVPAPGVKAGRIAALADDLAITIRAPSVRVAPIPGKGAVGVEVPNPTARMVMLRELFESPEWIKTRATLPIALGQDLEGKAVIADLAKMPHLLIAGATGSGKSVAINTIITSLIYRYTAKELRLLLIDPKMVELSMYNTLPHMRHKVVTNNNDAAAVLKWAIIEMNRRYELFHANGARNLSDFNRKVAEAKPLKNPPRPKPTLTTVSAEPPDTPPEPPEEEAYTEGPLPIIVMIVDELADLMMTVQAEIETPLAILAQKARAIGIHIILATQRPSVNVITGLIKANFASRIAFRVASKVDSRTILDQNGSEALLGNGDMLFLPPGKSEPIRLQGAFIGTEETERIMQWFQARREARKIEALQAPQELDILEQVRAKEAEEEGLGVIDGEGGERDSLFREAAEICIQNQGGSTSLLQRRLKIGYGRAARIIDQLHYAGILGAPDGSKPREVLIGFDQLDEYLGP